MLRFQTFLTYIKDNPSDLDVIMYEVYTELVSMYDQFIMFDGGAHKGWHTHRMLKLEGCVKIYAVEADPTMSGVLRDNLSKWHPNEAEKICVVASALQDNPNITSIPWRSSSSHVGRSSIINNASSIPTIWTSHKDMSYRDDFVVPATTIDTILKENNLPLPFIKTDLEGADFLALKGAVATLKKYRPIIAFENSSKAPEVHSYTLDDMKDFFKKYDYVAMNYIGEPLIKENWFDFYEAWAIPLEYISLTKRLIKSSINRRLD